MVLKDRPGAARIRAMNLPCRAPGLAILLTVVAVGMGIPAFYRWKFVDLGRERDEILPTS